MLVFTDDDMKMESDVSLCTPDIDVNNQKAFGGSVSFFKLE